MGFDRISLRFAAAALVGIVVGVPAPVRAAGPYDTINAAVSTAASAMRSEVATFSSFVASHPQPSAASSAHDDAVNRVARARAEANDDIDDVVAAHPGKAIGDAADQARGEIATEAADAVDELGALLAAAPGPTTTTSTTAAPTTTTTTPATTTTAPRATTTTTTTVPPPGNDAPDESAGAPAPTTSEPPDAAPETDGSVSAGTEASTTTTTTPPASGMLSLAAAAAGNAAPTPGPATLGHVAAPITASPSVALASALISDQDPVDTGGGERRRVPPRVEATSEALISFLRSEVPPALAEPVIGMLLVIRATAMAFVSGLRMVFLPAAGLALVAWLIRHWWTARRPADEPSPA